MIFAFTVLCSSMLFLSNQNKMSFITVNLWIHISFKNEQTQDLNLNTIYTNVNFNRDQIQFVLHFSIKYLNLIEN